MMPPISGVWGWPWHGVCTGGNITLPNASTKAITQPPNGMTWLYDAGLPAISRTAPELLEDASNGYEWRNYALISGGTLHGTNLGANAFIHRDESGKNWLIRLTFSFPEYELQRVRVGVSIVPFGVFGGGAKTPVSKTLNGQCTYITYISFGYTYSDTDAQLEDVWTNGARCLISVAKLTGGGPDPYLRDIYSLLEITITGNGGADGSGLVFAIVEVRKDTELTQGFVGYIPTNVVSGLPNHFSAATVNNICAPGDNSSEHVRRTHTPYFESGLADAWEQSNVTSQPNYVSVYARYAYYDVAGLPVAARIKAGWWGSREYQGGSNSPSGEFVVLCGSGGYTNTWVSKTTMTMTGDNYFGMAFIANDTVIDSVTCKQSVTITQVLSLYDNYLEYVYNGGTPDPLRVTTTVYGAAVWSGSLAASLPMGAVPVQGPGLWAFDNQSYYDAGVYVATPLLNTVGIAKAWRDVLEIKSAEAAINGTATLGIQRMGAKAAAFFKPGATRTYGNVYTPIGVKTTALTPVGNLYFSFNRKTGAFTFSENPICYV